MLEIEGLSLAWGLTEILHDIDLEIAPGNILAVFGRNGAGKTTLLQGIAELGPTRLSGTVRIDGSNSAGWEADRIARAGVVYVPDTGGVFRTLTVEENLRLGGAHVKGKGASIEAAFELFPVLAERRGLLAGLLSGGQRRMLGIARGVLQQPRYLLLDEPTEGLHPQVFAPIVNALSVLRDGGRTGVVWIDRRVNLALELADAYAVIERGRVTASGNTSSARAEDILDRMTV